jgi:hypothetical protein
MNIVLYNYIHLYVFSAYYPGSGIRKRMKSMTSRLSFKKKFKKLKKSYIIYIIYTNKFLYDVKKLLIFNKTIKRVIV